MAVKSFIWCTHNIILIFLAFHFFSVHAISTTTLTKSSITGSSSKLSSNTNNNTTSTKTLTSFLSSTSKITQVSSFTTISIIKTTQTTTSSTIATTPKTTQSLTLTTTSITKTTQTTTSSITTTPKITQTARSSTITATATITQTTKPVSITSTTKTTQTATLTTTTATVKPTQAATSSTVTSTTKITSSTSSVKTSSNTRTSVSTTSIASVQSNGTTYSWEVISPRSDCPSYTPTMTLASSTLSSNGVKVTAFIDPFGGAIPKHFAIQNETANGPNYIVRTDNSSQILVFQPGMSVIIVDNNGITAYDEQCQNGTRLFIPGFFDLRAGQTKASSSSASRSVSTSKPTSSNTSAALSQRSILGQEVSELASRAQSPSFSVSWRFVDSCGRPKDENILSLYTGFACTYFTGLIYRGSTYSSTGGGSYAARIQSPTIDVKACESQVDNLLKSLDGGVWDEIDQAYDVVDWLADHFDDFGIGASPLARRILQRLGLLGAGAVGLATIGDIITTVSVAMIVTKHSGPLLKKGLCNIQCSQYSLTAATEHYGERIIDSQSAPFKNIGSKKLELPTTNEEACGCTNFSEDSYNCGSCGNKCHDPESCVEGKCVREDWCPDRKNPDPCIGSCNAPIDGCLELDQYNFCNTYDNSGPSCICRSTSTGGMACVFDNFDWDCRMNPARAEDFRACIDDSDCQCGSRCIIDNCCGKPICAWGGTCTPETYKSCFGKDP